LISIKIPGVSKILGSFSSSCKGPAVCTPDNIELVANFTDRDDGFVRVCLIKTGECKKFQLNTYKFKKEDKWCNAVKGVYATMSKSYGLLPCFDIDIDGELIDCEGHIVLSAVTLATIQAINKKKKLGLESEEILKIAAEAMHTINEDGNLVDVVTMLFVKRGQFVFFDGLTQKYKIIDNPFTGTPYSMILLDPHIPVSALRDEVADKEKEIYDANHAFNEIYTGCSVVQLSSADFRERISSFDEDVKKYCTYLFDEARAAVSAQVVLETKNLYALESMFAKIKRTIDENLEFICPEINWLVKRAYENPGCIGSCPVFEGYKTRAVVVMKNTCIPQLEEHAAEYQHVFGFTITADIIGDYKPKAR